MCLLLLPGWHRYVRRRLYIGDIQTIPLNYSPFSRFSMLTRGVSDGRHEKRKPSTDISQRTMNVDHLLPGLVHCHLREQLWAIDTLAERVWH